MFIEIHSRSAFSFLEGTTLPEDLIATCARMKMPAMALLDRDGVYGAPRFYMAAKKAGIKAHLGAEVACDFSPQGHADTKKRIKPSVSDSSVPLSLRGEVRLPILVSAGAGYQNLRHLITKMKLRSKKGEGAVCTEELQERATGMICLSRSDDGRGAAALVEV